MHRKCDATLTEIAQSHKNTIYMHASVCTHMCKPQGYIADCISNCKQHNKRKQLITVSVLGQIHSVRLHSVHMWSVSVHGLKRSQRDRDIQSPIFLLTEIYFRDVTWNFLRGGANLFVYEYQNGNWKWHKEKKKKTRRLGTCQNSFTLSS